LEVVTMTEKTLVMALGNILRGDDGVGAAVIEALRERPALPEVEWLDGGTPGFEAVLMMQGYDHVIVVDAADMGDEPGVWRWFSADEVRLKSKDLHLRGTLHYAGLAEALSLGAALDILPPRIDIVGVQPQQIDWEIGMSAAVVAVIPVVAEAIYAALAAEPVV
jgi:hydrogenase maturation protease